MFETVSVKAQFHSEETREKFHFAIAREWITIVKPNVSKQKYRITSKKDPTV